MGISLISTQIATTYVFKAGPGEFGWANCTVNDSTGELSIQSDWGSWAHGWSPDPRHLGAPSLTAFIGNRSDGDYLARKLQREGHAGRRWSLKETGAALCRLASARRLEHGREQLDGRLESEDYYCGQVPNRLLDRYTEAGLPIFSHLQVDAPSWRDPDRKERLRYLDREGARRLWNAIGEVVDEGSRSPDQFFEQVFQIEDFTDYVTGEPWQHSVNVQTPEDQALREIVLPALIQACRAQALVKTVTVVVAE
jgi:hypothetical protein